MKELESGHREENRDFDSSHLRSSYAPPPLNLSANSFKETTPDGRNPWVRGSALNSGPEEEEAGDGLIIDDPVAESGQSTAAPDAPDGNEGNDLTGKRSLIRTDTTLYAGMDYSRPICRIHRNTEILVLRDCVRDDWAEVRIEGGETGFLNRNYILQRPEGIDPGTRLHRVQGPEYRKTQPKPPRALSQKEGIYEPRPQYLIQGGEYFAVVKNGETLEQIIQAHYPERKGMDLRTIANAILFVNNSTNLPDRGIYVKDDGLMDKWMQGIGYNYPDIVIKAGHDILLPGWPRILELRDKVASGSISLGAVQKFWPDGWGCALDVFAGLTFIAPSLGLGFNAYFFRRGNHLILHFSALMEGGVSVGVGAGISVNKRRKGKPGEQPGLAPGLGAEAGIDAEVMGENFGLLEFEIPMQAGVVAKFLWEQAGKVFRSDEEQKAAANDFVSTFDDEPARYLTKALAQTGGRANIYGEAGIDVMKAGEDTQKKDLGGGRELRSHHSTNAERNTTEGSTSPFRKSPLEQIKGILKGGNQGISDAAMSRLGSLLRAVSGVNAGAGAGFATGMEYSQTPKGERRVAIFMEADAWAKAGVPFAPNLTAAIGTGGRIIFVWNRRWNMWTPESPEMYLFGGDLDNYTGGAYELSVRMGGEQEDVPDGEQGEGGKVKEAIVWLRRMKFSKRFMVSLSSRKLRARAGRMNRFRALVSSDAFTRGLTAKVAVTIEMDLAELNGNSELNSVLEAIIRNNEQGSPLDAVKDAIGSVLSDGDDSEYVAFVALLLNEDSVTKCTLHVEAGVAGAISGKIGEGAKLQLDVSGSLGLVYEESLPGSAVFGALEGSEDEEKAGKIALAINADPLQMEELSMGLMERGS